MSKILAAITDIVVAIWTVITGVGRRNQGRCYACRRVAATSSDDLVPAADVLSNLALMTLATEANLRAVLLDAGKAPEEIVRRLAKVLAEDESFAQAIRTDLQRRDQLKGSGNAVCICDSCRESAAQSDLQGSEASPASNLSASVPGECCMCGTSISSEPSLALLGNEILTNKSLMRRFTGRVTGLAKEETLKRERELSRPGYAGSEEGVSWATETAKNYIDDLIRHHDRPLRVCDTCYKLRAGTEPS